MRLGGVLQRERLVDEDANGARFHDVEQVGVPSLSLGR